MSNEWSQRRAAALEQIRRNIAESGYHLYVVSGGAAPRFAYTVGLRESLGVELVFAGGLLYDLAPLKRIVHDATSKSLDSMFTVDALGAFSFREAAPSWVSALLLGAVDYYGGGNVRAYQIVPDDAHRTIDVPDLSRPYSAASETAWRYYFEPWPFEVPRASSAMIDLPAMRGARITAAARWEDDYWELFADAGPDMDRDAAREVPLGVLLGADESLRAVVDLPVGGALHRDETSAWQGRGR